MGQFARSRRRRWLVDRKQQIPFVASLALQVLGATGIMALSAVILDRRIAARAMAFIESQDAAPFADDVASASRTLLLLTFVLLALSTLGIALFALKASNRLAGPAARLRQVLEELGRSNTSQRVVFRGKDRLGDLAEILNRRMLRLDEEQNRLKSEIPFLASSLETCRTDIDLGKFPLDQDELRRLETTLRNLAEIWHDGGTGTATEPS